MLFTLVMEVLSALIRQANNWNLLQNLGIRDLQQRTSLSVHDLVIFLSPVQGIFGHNQAHFQHLSGASGLACNLQKSQFIPIGCVAEDIALTTSLLPCQVVDFPVRYLASPFQWVSSALQPLVDRVADRLPTWKGRLVNKSGRLELIKSTLTAIPIHIAICIRLPGWVFKALEKIMKVFLWTGTKVVNAGKCLVAWPKVQKQKELGGLGILISNWQARLYAAVALGAPQ